MGCNQSSNADSTRSNTGTQNGTTKTKAEDETMDINSNSKMNGHVEGKQEDSIDRFKNELMSQLQSIADSMYTFWFQQAQFIQFTYPIGDIILVQPLFFL